jgi:hypothetical protein
VEEAVSHLIGSHVELGAGREQVMPPKELMEHDAVEQPAEPHSEDHARA